MGISESYLCSGYHPPLPPISTYSYEYETKTKTKKTEMWINMSSAEPPERQSSNLKVFKTKHFEPNTCT